MAYYSETTVSSGIGSVLSKPGSYESKSPNLTHFSDELVIKSVFSLLLLCSLTGVQVPTKWLS